MKLWGFSMTVPLCIMPICLLQNQSFESDSLVLSVTIALEIPVGVWKYSETQHLLVSQEKPAKKCEVLIVFEDNGKISTEVIREKFHLQNSEQIRNN